MSMGQAIADVTDKTNSLPECDTEEICHQESSIDLLLQPFIQRTKNIKQNSATIAWFKTFMLVHKGIVKNSAKQLGRFSHSLLQREFLKILGSIQLLAKKIALNFRTMNYFSCT
jgi:hypothetical protein